MLISGFFVFFMQAGFAMLCAGSVRSKNVMNILIKNVLDACIGCMAYFCFGYAISYGTKSSSSFSGEFAGEGWFFLAKGDHDAAFTDWHVFFFQWAFTAAAAIPELEVLVAPLATKGLRGGEVRNAIEDGLPGGGADAIRVVDAGARLIPTRHGDGTPPLVVESGWTEVSGKKDRTQRVERRRVIRGIDPSAAVAPGSPTRSNSPGPGGLVDAEIAVTADMTVVPESGEYRFDTKLEAFVLGGEDDSADESHGDPVRKRVVFRRRWTEVAPAKLGIAAKHMSAAA